MTLLLIQKRWTVLILMACCCIAVPLPSQENEPAGPPIKVMSFNIRYGTANDGENHWKHRSQNVVTTIKEFDPDLLGTQETLGFQAKFLREQLPSYSYWGRTRDNNGKGEQCGILYRKERFDLLESGHFWLSETPNVPASKSWDSSLPRMASWVKLFDRQAKSGSGSVFYLVNTHFDHRGAKARANSAKLLVERFKRMEPGVPIILTGDFNTAPQTAPIRTLSQSLVDSYGHTHIDETEAGTFGGYRGRKDGPRIDYVFVSPNTKIQNAAIVHRNFDGRDPSDHFPVTSVVQLAPLPTDTDQ